MKMKKKVKVLVLQSCLTFCYPMDCNPLDSSVYGILPARILEWVATFSRGSSQLRDWSRVSCTDSLPSEQTGKLPYCYPAPLIANFHLMKVMCPHRKKEKDIINTCIKYKTQFSLWNAIRSVQFSRSVMSDSLWPHGLQHARPPCPSPIPRVYSNSCPLSRWCHLHRCHFSRWDAIM